METKNLTLEEREENFEIVEEFLSEKDHVVEVGNEFQEVIGKNNNL